MGSNGYKALRGNLGKKIEILLLSVTNYLKL